MKYSKCDNLRVFLLPVHAVLSSAILVSSCGEPDRAVIESVCLNSHCFQVVEFCYPGVPSAECGTEIYRVTDTAATAYQDGLRLFRGRGIRVGHLTTVTDSLLRIPILHADWPDPEILIPLSWPAESIDTLLTPDRSTALWSQDQGRFAASTYRIDSLSPGVCLYITEKREQVEYSRTFFFPGAESVMARFEDQYTMIIAVRWGELPRCVFRFRIVLWRETPEELRMY